MQGDEPLIPADGDTPVTDGFQLQFGPDGRCRLVLLGGDAAPIARLDLDGPGADRLAEALAGRREVYARTRRD